MQKEKGKQSCKLAEEEGCERNPFRYARPARTPPPEARASLGPGHSRPVRGGVRSMGLARRTRVVHRQAARKRHTAQATTKEGTACWDEIEMRCPYSAVESNMGRVVAHDTQRRRGGKREETEKPSSPHSFSFFNSLSICSIGFLVENACEKEQCVVVWHDPGTYTRHSNLSQ